jgi:hypothetical protein
MRESLKLKLIQYIKGYQGEKIPHYQLEAMVKQWGFRSSNMERRLREMAEVGKIYEHNCIKFYYWRSDSPVKQETAPVSEIKAKVDKWAAQFKKEPITSFTPPPLF